MSVKENVKKNHPTIKLLAEYLGKPLAHDKLEVGFPIRIKAESLKQLKSKGVRKLEFIPNASGGGKFNINYLNERGEAISAEQLALIETESVGSTTAVVMRENGIDVIEPEVQETPDQMRNPENQDQGEVSGAIARVVTDKQSADDDLDSVPTIRTLESNLAKAAEDKLPANATKTNPLLARRNDSVNWVDFPYFEYAFEPTYANAVTKNSSKEAAYRVPPKKKPKATSKSTVSFDSFYQNFISALIKKGTESVAISKFFQLDGQDSAWVTETFVRIHKSALEKNDGLNKIFENYKFLDLSGRTVLLQSVEIPEVVANRELDPLKVASDLMQGQLENYIDMVSYLDISIKVRNMPFPAIKTILDSIEKKLIDKLAPMWNVTVEELSEIWSEYIENEKSAEAARKPEPLRVPAGYDFSYFTPYSCNVGFRYIYRQEIRPIGIQSGDLVKAIPLGPKQVQKVSIKSFKKSKSSTVSESGTEFESSADTTTTGRTTTDETDESSDVTEVGLSASGGYDAGGVKAELKASYNNKTSNSHRENKQMFNENLQKTASRTRNQTRVVVTTETENGFETESSSEIQNPNDELAVTYMYSRIQKIYEAYTALAEIETVVYVAEPLPEPREIDEDWLRKHGDVLMQNLLDSSIRSDLAAILRQPKIFTYEDRHFNKIDAAMDKASLQIATLAKNSGALSQLDIISDAQKNYFEASKMRLEADRMAHIRAQQLQRVVSHVISNIIFYCQKIWLSENPSQRALRYKKHKINFPIIWEMQPSPNAQTLDIDELELSYLDINFVGKGDLKTGGSESIGDIIDPFEILGFIGNYVAYRLRRPTWFSKDPNKVLPALSLLRGRFNDPNRPGQILDPERELIKEELQELRDPNVHDQNGVPKNLSKELCREIIDLIPRLRIETLAFNEEEMNAFITEKKDLLRDSYVEYLYRKRNSKKFVIDTDNLMIDLLRGDGTILEDFKREHRWIDVKKADQERIQMILENERRLQLLAGKHFGDPKVGKIVAVGKAEDFGIQFNASEE